MNLPTEGFSEIMDGYNFRRRLKTPQIENEPDPLSGRAAFHDQGTED